MSYSHIEEWIKDNFDDSDDIEHINLELESDINQVMNRYSVPAPWDGQGLRFKGITFFFYLGLVGYYNHNEHKFVKLTSVFDWTLEEIYGIKKEAETEFGVLRHKKSGKYLNEDTQFDYMYLVDSVYQAQITGMNEWKSMKKYRYDWTFDLDEYGESDIKDFDFVKIQITLEK